MGTLLDRTIAAQSERDAMRAEVGELRSQASTIANLCGQVNAYRRVYEEAVAERDAAIAERDALRAENARLREALMEMLGPDPTSPHAPRRTLAEAERIRSQARAALGEGDVQS